MDTQGIYPDTINLITDNLRDRYTNGFPILKELIQNADDAQARRLVFSRHPGLPQADHPLLTGPALWFFNDGGFKPSDKRALRSFGINSKAGDAATIGKFGLGMKSVFHLCEVVFYVAFDGTALHREALNPWKTPESNPRLDWDGRQDNDWIPLQNLGHEVAGKPGDSWFLLWIPLRRKAHLTGVDGIERGAIIERFPGDDGSQDLGFLMQESLSQQLAEVLPLLRHLHTVEHRDADHGFYLHLVSENRLLDPSGPDRVDGQVLDVKDSPVLRLSGNRLNDSAGWANQLKAKPQWPKIRYRDENGHECIDADKTCPEAAVLFCSGDLPSRGHLHWTVFLPMEEGAQPLRNEGLPVGHALILHGQFFVDAGRRKIHDQDSLHEPPVPDPDDEATLRQTWNRLLAQRVLAPGLIPALEYYVQESGIKNAECVKLTRALADSSWFRRFRPHACATDAWVRVLDQKGSRWSRISGDHRDRLRPMRAVQSHPQRPWDVFPRLSSLDVILCDIDAPSLAARPPQWSEHEITALLNEVTGLFQDGPSMDYLETALAAPFIAGPFIQTEPLQDQLVQRLRSAMARTDRAGRQEFAEKAKRLIRRVADFRRLDLSAFLPETVLRALWTLRTPILLVPKELETQDASAKPDTATLLTWLEQLDREIRATDGPALKPLLATAQGLLSKNPDTCGQFLRNYSDLRIIAVRDPLTGHDRAASTADIQQALHEGRLFGFAQGLQAAQLGLTPPLARVLPQIAIWLVRSDTFKQLFPDSPLPPRADDTTAILASVGHYVGTLGGFKERYALLEKARDIDHNNNIARRGLRYLLHGSLAHREEDQETLWLCSHGQHSAWSKLWRQLDGSSAWTLIPEALARRDLPIRRQIAGVKELDASNLLAELAQPGVHLREPSEFTVEEREEILAAIDDESLWRRLPLHTCTDETPVAANRALVYRAPDEDVDDDPLLIQATLIAPARQPMVANQQRQWLQPFDARARIELVLSAENAARHWRTLIHALADFDLQADPALCERIRAKPWLPTRQRSVVKPMDVINLPPGLAEATERLTSEHWRHTGNVIFTVPAQLAEPLVEHPVWQNLATVLCSSEQQGLEQLTLLLADLDSYAIGDWSEAPDQSAIELMASCRALPGWRLLADVINEPTFGQAAWSTLKDGMIRQQLAKQRLIDVLGWLGEHNSQWKTRKALFDQHLGWLNDGDQAKNVLSELHLVSASEKWQPASALCAGAQGIQPDHLLDKKQARILGSSIQRADSHYKDTAQLPLRMMPEAFDAALTTTKNTLVGYFRAWEGGCVPEPMIGILLGMLGQPIRKLADQFLQGRPFDVLIDEISWTPIGKDPMHKTWMDGRSRSELMAKIEVAVRIAEGNRIELPNLCGDWIDFPIAADSDSLLIGGIHWVGGYRALIQLRPIDPGTLDEARLSKLLRATAETLYAGFYNQPPCDFSDLWNELGRSDQVEIRVARRLILDDFPFHLRLLKITHPGITQALSRWDEARRCVAELESRQHSTEHARREQFQAIEALSVLVEEDQDARHQILTGVRDKLKGFQYTDDSIPFELFQNADDAAIELSQIEAFRDNPVVPAAARRIVLDCDDNAIRVLHWGRPINARGPADFGEEERGFGRDLEKMLMLSSSDKQPEHTVTGKFGLGFKSVLLACEQPRILSGRLAVEILAGMLPQLDLNSTSLRNILKKHTDPGNRLIGTAIELPDIPLERQLHMLSRFHELAGLLCVFGRQIREITLARLEDETHFSWQPQRILPTIEFGRLQLADASWGNSIQAICLRTSTGALVFALGSRGFRPLPKETPNLWVTTPLHGNSHDNNGLGFACTAPFSPDAGRARLAGDTPENSKIASDLGAEAGEVLRQLFEHGQEDWPSLCRNLEMDPLLSPHDFWHSFWADVASLCLRRTQGAAANLARELTLAMLRRLGTSARTIPNGLPGDMQAMIDRADAHYQLSKRLATDQVVAILSEWNRFTAKYARQHLVSEEIGKILKTGKMADPLVVSLPALLALLNPPKVEPEDARALGGIHALTEEDDREWAAQKLKQSLRQLKFRTLNDQWIVSAELIAGGGQTLDEDEPLRYALAPSNRRLHPNYWEDAKNRQALDFFLLARERLKATVTDLAQWILAARDTDRQLAALRYIVSGKHANDVADAVRGQGWLNDVLCDRSLLSAFDTAETNKLQRLLASDTQIDRGLDPERPTDLSPPIVPSLSIGEALNRLSDWWEKNGKQLEKEHRQSLYPSGTLNLSINDSGRFDRSSWLTLFALGAFQSMGLTREIQHRGFIEYCREPQRDWWQIFAELDPKEHPDRWMDVIEEYAESQHDDEKWTQWIAQFPKLYRFRRQMDVYVDLFLSIDRFSEPFRLESILASKASEDFQRGGIEAPPLNRTLRVGGPLIIRELLHHGVIKNPHAIPHAYAPIQRIRDWFANFSTQVETSKDIHNLLTKHLGPERVTFNGAYDIPLRLISVDEGLQARIL